MEVDDGDHRRKGWPRRAEIIPYRAEQGLSATRGYRRYNFRGAPPRVFPRAIPERRGDGVVLATKSDKPTSVFFSPSSPTLFSFFILLG